MKCACASGNVIQKEAAYFIRIFDCIVYEFGIDDGQVSLTVYRSSRFGLGVDEINVVDADIDV